MAAEVLLGTDARERARARLWLIFTTIGLGILMVGLVLTGFGAKRRLVREIEQDPQALLVNERFVKLTVDGHLDELDRELARIAKLDDLTNALVKGDQANAVEQLRPPLNRLRRGPLKVSRLTAYSPVGVAVVRAHEPERHGDSVLNDRRIVFEAVNTREIVKGIEVENDVPYLYVATPLYHAGKFVGLLEIGTSLANALDAIRTVTGGEVAMLVGNRAVQSSNDGLFKTVAPLLKVATGQGARRQVVTPGNATYATSLIPMKDFSGREVMTLVIASDASGITEVLRKTNLATIGISAAGFILAMALLYALARKLDAFYGTLEHKVQERTAELKESEQRFRALVESATDAFLVFRRDGRLIDVNQRACDSLLYERDELLGLSVKDIEPTFDVAGLDWERLRTAEATVVETVHRRKDGYGFPVEVSLGVMEHHGEQLVLALARDISQRKRQEEALREANAVRQRLEGEIAVARDIQMSLLPRKFVRRDHVDVFATLEPAREVGGDFYDVFLLDGGRVGFVVGDVSGKGVPAALHMAMTKTLIKSAARRGMGPAEILAAANEEVCFENDACIFVTIFMGILDTATGEVTYASAGHNPPFLLRRSGEVELVKAAGIAVGILEEAVFETQHLTMRAGDSLVMYTDGVTEATSTTQELFTENRLRDEVAALGDQSSQQMVTSVMDKVQAFQYGAPQADDITILAIRYVE
ncbi:MAG TPA: SpoIIE family protein phosphatase [Terriglobales bacterium]|nr:SpoIIE family protein phosphatase [Terriglobales bacterium]